MPRPTKQGIDFFPVECQFDEKTELFILENGAEGLGVLVTLWQLIYSNNGYYIEYNNDLPLLIKRRVSSDINSINSIINSVIDRNILVKTRVNDDIYLTSKAIQKRFFSAVEKRKKVELRAELVISDVSDIKNAVYSDINSVNSDKNYTEYSKEQNSRVENSIKNTYVEVPDKRSEIARRVFDHWKLKMKKNNSAKLTTDRRQKIYSRLTEGYSENDLILAIDGCSNSDFHMGREPKTNGKVFDDLTLILRNGSYVEKFQAITNSQKIRENEIQDWANSKPPVDADFIDGEYTKHD